MPLFVPDGFLTMWQARDRLGRAMYSDLWDRCPNLRENAALAAQAADMHKALIVARQRELWPKVQAGLSPLEKRRRAQLEGARTIGPRSRPAPRHFAELDDDADARRFVRLDAADLKAIDNEISTRFAEPLARVQRCGKAKARLRAALHSGAVSATLLTVHGTEHPVPREFWASERAEKALDTGEASYHPGIYGLPRACQLEGRIFVSEAEIAAALERLIQRPNSSASAEAQSSLPPTTAEPVEAKQSSPGPTVRTVSEAAVRNWLRTEGNARLPARKGWPQAKQDLGGHFSRAVFRRMLREERQARGLPVASGRPKKQ